MSRAVVCCAAFGQAGGVAEDGAGHAELPRLGRHHAGEPRFRTAESSPSAVAASLADLVTSDEIAVSTVTDPPARTPSLVGGLAEACVENGILRLLGDLAGLERLEDEIERHHLGERGRVARLVGLAENSVLPVLASTTIAAYFEFAAAGVAATAVATAKPRQARLQA